MKLRLFISLVAGICLIQFVTADPTPSLLTSVKPTLPTTVIRPVISPQELQELSSARVKAMKTNPDLIAKAQALGLKMRAFQEKLNAAMLKEDPQIAPILDQLERRITPPQSSPKPLMHITPSPVSGH